MTKKLTYEQETKIEKILEENGAKIERNGWKTVAIHFSNPVNPPGLKLLGKIEALCKQNNLFGYYLGETFKRLV